MRHTVITNLVVADREVASEAVRPVRLVPHAREARVVLDLPRPGVRERDRRARQRVGRRRGEEQQRAQREREREPRGRPRRDPEMPAPRRGRRRRRRPRRAVGGRLESRRLGRTVHRARRLDRARGLVTRRRRTHSIFTLCVF